MSNFQTTVSIADIYGAEWWERNKAELDREWEWSLGVATKGQTFACLGRAAGINSLVCSCPRYEIRIILHRRKPKPPTLREVYGTDKVKIPVGWEWTGEFKIPEAQEWYLCEEPKKSVQWVIAERLLSPRLILRKRPKKVWFKAEENKRRVFESEWFFDHVCLKRWVKAVHSTSTVGFLCATRHVEVDQTVQIVTQSDIDKVSQ